MQYEVQQLDGFFIAGIAVRTTNQDNQSGTDIGNLWGQWYQQQMPQKLVNRISDDLYCVYTDYEAGDQGYYRTVLGYKVPSLQALPEGCLGIEIPASRYFRFTSAGKIPEAVLQTWWQIWQSGFDRKFAADFDLYPGGNIMEQGTVFTYLSVL